MSGTEDIASGSAQRPDRPPGARHGSPGPGGGARGSRHSSPASVASPSTSDTALTQKVDKGECYHWLRWRWGDLDFDDVTFCQGNETPLGQGQLCEASFRSEIQQKFYFMEK